VSTTNATDPEPLRQRIGNAFSGRPYPGDDRIALTRDAYPSYEGNRVSSFFAGKDWRELTFTALVQGYTGDPTAAIHFMQDEGFLYFLPAFLLMALDPAAREMTDALVFSLTDPGPQKSDDSRSFRARMARLSTDERKVVVDLLQYLAERADLEGEPDNAARHALRSYWEEPLP
jgi:hypothetical protein